ncbi:MAG: hypothetical protein HZC19_02225 [Candidatus Omnitrophica bacterium]|nr:hypothetical protein [Candidatus Omnitrophota bacterium]
MHHNRSGIDWDWVKKELFIKERIPELCKGGPDETIHAAVDRCLKEAKALARPQVLSAVKKITAFDGYSVMLEGPVTFSGKRLISYIKGATHLHLFLVTVGGEIEAQGSRWMSKGEGLYGYLLDSIGSLVVESLAEAMEEELRKTYLFKDETVSMRLSPGYCDWPIEEQSVMAKALDFSKIGIALTEKCMMVPKKPISAMVGVGPKDIFSKRASQCVTCDKMACDYRRVS